MAAAESDIKTFKIVGGFGETNTKKRGTRSKKGQAGGEQPIIKITGYEQQSVATNAAPVNVPQRSMVPELPRVVPQPSFIPSPDKVAAPQGNFGEAQTGGRQVIIKRNKLTRSVHLKAKGTEAPKQLAVKKHHTRKIRKVSIASKSLHKRLTRAKKIQEKIQKTPIEDLKKELVKRGLIKETSKAPPTVLRQIASDSQIVAGKAL
jgi:hypothetical protein